MDKNPYMYAIMLIFMGMVQAHASPVEGYPRIKIGVIAGSTGLAAPTGISVRRGVELADATYDTHDRVEFIFEDDAFQPKNAVSSAEKLISREKVHALVTFSGSTSLAVSAIAERRAIPMVAITPLKSVSSGKRFVYTLYIPPYELVNKLSDAIRQMNQPRVALVTSTQDALLALRGELTRSLDAPAAAPDSVTTTVVFDEEVRPGDLELYSFVSRMLSTKPDVIVSFTLPPQVSMVAKLVRSQGFKGQLIVGPPGYNYPEIAAAGGALAGAWLIGPQSGLSDVFFRHYREVYSESAVPEGMCGHDAAKLLIEAAATESIADFLAGARDLSGAAGVYPKSADNLFQVPAELRVITREGEIIGKAEGVAAAPKPPGPP